TSTSTGTTPAPRSSRLSPPHGSRPDLSGSTFECSRPFGAGILNFDPRGAAINEGEGWFDGGIGSGHRGGGGTGRPLDLGVQSRGTAGGPGGGEADGGTGPSRPLPLHHQGGAGPAL